ncbi:MAG TPA: isoprenylcysteine carboxylmethyltransferase family protein [Vicinamibacterales bacterium]|nr:isoprenylcysteine carboxylmethyltransferase family protein [Vicinamibacterales bacterium]
MQLVDQLAETGQRLFRGRSYLPLLVLPFFALTFAAGNLRPAPTWWKAVCLLVSLAGLAVRVYVTGSAPEGTSERSTTSIRAVVLNTRGAYSIVRHPLYAANTLIALGLTMRSPSWLFPVLVLLLHALYFERIAIAEERFLRARFGAEFEAWADRVPALMPRSFGDFVPVPFEWRRAAGEVHALLVVGAGFFVADVLENSRVAGRFAIGAAAWSLLVATSVPFLIYAARKRVRAR